MQPDEALSDFECIVPQNVLTKYNYSQIIVKITKGINYEFLRIVGFNEVDEIKISPNFFSIFGRGGVVEYLDSKAFAPPGKINLLINFYPTEKNLNEISYFLKDFSVIRIGQKLSMKKNSTTSSKIKEIKVIELLDSKMNKITNSLISVNKEVLFDYVVKFKEFSFDSDISII